MVQAGDAAEKSRALRALAYASSAADVQRTLEYALNAEVKSQDVRTLVTLTGIRSGPNLQAAWSFLTTCVTPQCSPQDEAAIPP